MGEVGNLELPTYVTMWPYLQAQSHTLSGPSIMKNIEMVTSDITIYQHQPYSFRRCIIQYHTLRHNHPYKER
jgi:hypothetical protein